jgi:hypothetical protein
MTGDEFGRSLLGALEETRNENMRQLAKVIRRALNMKEPEPVPMPVHPHSRVPSEYPQWRIKYDKAGNEIARRRCNNPEELGRLLREDYGFVHCAVPIDPRLDAPVDPGLNS